MRFAIFCVLAFIAMSCSPKEQLADREALVYLTIDGEDFDIYQGDVLGKWERRLTSNPGRDWFPQWNSHLKRLIYYAKDTTGRLSVMSMDLTSKEIISLSNEGLANFRMSPNGEQIFHTEAVGGVQHIWRCNLSGENRSQLTHDNSYNDHFSISPDGTKLLFISDRSGSTELYLMDLTSLTSIQLTDNQMIEEYSTWSPDGAQIAFTMRAAEEDSKEDIYIMNADGSGLSQFTATPYAEKEVAWSLSGKKIAFHGTTENDGDQIYTLDLADGKFTKITSGEYYRGEPAWVEVSDY